MAKTHIRKDDKVIVLAGSDKGKTGKVLKVLRDEDRVVVEGVHVVSRARSRMRRIRKVALSSRRLLFTSPMLV